ncbi:hypothetical protein AYJ54_05290 [Bradyrhizobium centrolobii]|uniref:Uncharacterized protein n=1 Tax=Bradyrhizobium centrolobii TaxID=1505087 RepID=A0A176Z7A0_9BRAD|nr:hypothetical protein AYJ54_05290 [Bradyrhizobium centrolobii]
MAFEQNIFLLVSDRPTLRELCIRRVRSLRNRRWALVLILVAAQPNRASSNNQDGKGHRDGHWDPFEPFHRHQ